MVLTMDSTLRPVNTCRCNGRRGGATHAHTCVPCSGMMVKHTWSSLSLTHARGPSELSDAVSSALQLDQPLGFVQIGRAHV